MLSRGPAGVPRGLLALIVGATIVPLLTLLWLGWRLLGQDRVLEREQVQLRAEHGVHDPDPAHEERDPAIASYHAVLVGGRGGRSPVPDTREAPFQGVLLAALALAIGRWWAA